VLISQLNRALHFHTVSSVWEKIFANVRSLWYRGRPWLEYSITSDAAFCFPCRTFRLCGSKEESCFLAGGYRNWKAATEEGKGLSKHEKSAQHVANMTSWMEKSRRQTANKEISTMVNNEQLERNRYYVSSIIDIVHFLAANELPLRGSNDKAPTMGSESEKSDDGQHSSGLFLKLFEFTIRKDQALHEAFKTIPRNATYTSHDIQNDIIDIMAGAVKDDIVKEIGSAMYSIKVDGTRDPTGRENVSIVVRYVTAENVIRERLLSMGTSDQFDADSLTDVVLKQISSSGLSPDNILSQCYDGASVMAGCHGGVQKILQDRLEKTIPYVHCYNHRLHLIVVSVMSGEAKVLEFFDLCGCLYNFTKRPNMAVIYQGNRLKRLLDQRWTGHWETLNNILTSFDDLVDLLKDAETNKRGSADIRVEASGLLKNVLSTEFVFIAETAFAVLETLKPTDKSLQDRSIDLLTASQLISATMTVIEEMRSDESFQSVWSEAVSWVPIPPPPPPAEEIVETTTRRRKLNPRYNDSIITETVGQRDNQNSLNPDQFKTELKRLYMAVIDSVIGEMRRRFVNDVNRTYLESLQATDPASDCFLCYDKLLPLAKLGNVLLNRAELAVAKQHVATSHMLMPDATATTLSVMQDQVISKGTPSVRDVLSVALTLGASSSTCESTFSTLSRILTPYRRSMLHARKANLVVLAFEHDLTSGLLQKKELIMRKFNDMSSRRLQLF
jgi:hypothetical protein